MTAARATHTPNAAARAAQPDITPLAARSAGASLGFVGLECSSTHAQSVANQLNLLKIYCPNASERCSATFFFSFFLLRSVQQLEERVFAQIEARLLA